MINNTKNISNTYNTFGKNLELFRFLQIFPDDFLQPIRNIYLLPYAEYLNIFPQLRTNLNACCLPFHRVLWYYRFINIYVLYYIILNYHSV